MSQLAFVTVMQCDQCEQIEIFSGLEDHERFEMEWYGGLTVDLCSRCSLTPEGQRKINVERQAIEANSTNDRYSGRYEYAH